MIWLLLSLVAILLLVIAFLLGKLYEMHDEIVLIQYRVAQVFHYTVPEEARKRMKL